MRLFESVKLHSVVYNKVPTAINDLAPEVHHGLLFNVESNGVFYHLRVKKIHKRFMTISCNKRKEGEYCSVVHKLEIADCLKTVPKHNKRGNFSYKFDKSVTPEMLCNIEHYTILELEVSLSTSTKSNNYILAQRMLVCRESQHAENR